MCLLRTLVPVFAAFLILETIATAADINRVVIAVHGGLAMPRRDLTAEKEADIRNALKQSLTAGYDELVSKDGKSIQAVVAAIKVLEDSPLFNAGKGAVYTSGKTIELDASVMEGDDRRAGGVAAAQRIRNPIEAALAVMQRTPYVLLVGAGADQFAKDAGLQMVDPQYFETEHRLREYHEQKAGHAAPTSTTPADRPLRSKGTVGAVALDGGGTLAAGTSTGGLAYKLPGRVGDSPIVGAGTYADNRACAVSATGEGEFFIRSCAAYDVVAKMRYEQLTVADAAEKVVAEIHRMGGKGGLVALDHNGHLSWPYAADGMYRGFVDRDGSIQVHLFSE